MDTNVTTETGDYNKVFYLQRPINSGWKWKVVVGLTWSSKKLDMNMFAWVSNCAGETFQVSINNSREYSYEKMSQDFWRISCFFLALEH